MGMELAVEVTDAKLLSYGDLEHYEQLLVIIRANECDPDSGPKVTALKALSESVSCIHIIHHASLVSSILGMRMWNYGTNVMDALMEFVISLAVSSGQYLDLCLEMLVMNFMPPYSFVSLLNRSHGILRKGQVIDRVHSTLFGIAKLVPLAPLRLEEIVKQRMPHIHEKEPCFGGDMQMPSIITPIPESLYTVAEPAFSS